MSKKEDDEQRLVTQSPSSSAASASATSSHSSNDQLLRENMYRKQNLTSFAREMRKRQFRMVDRQKSSKPQALEKEEFTSPRSDDSFEVVGPAPALSSPTVTDKAEKLEKPENPENPSVAVKIEDEQDEQTPAGRPGGVVIQIDEADDIGTGEFEGYDEEMNPNSLMASSVAGASLAATRSSSVDDDDIKSQLSFIMKERLHILAKEVHRRTSAVREDLIRDDPEDAVSLASNMPKQEHRASLMSLIGLQKRSDSPTEKEHTKLVCGHRVKLTINTYGRFYMAWLSIVTICFLFNAFCIPLRSSYPYQTVDNWPYWFAADYFCDIIYFIDMVFIKPRLRFSRGGIQVKDPVQTRKHYLMTLTFKLDILSLIPTDLAYFFVGKMPIVRLNRILKISSFWLLFDMLDNSFSNPYAIRIARTLSYMIYIIHCNSCVYYKLSAWQAFGQIAYFENGKWYLNKWVYNNQGNAYIRCFYFTAAVATSTGNNPPPTNVIEYIYMTCSWMMGVFVFALLLGQIRDIVSNANRNREEFQRKMDMALGECIRLGLTKDLTDRVRDWFIYTWQQQKTLDEKKLIEKLPLKLQTDLALSVHYNTLSKVQLFQDADRALLRDLVLKLRPVIFLPGDMICQKGDVGKEMYIVNQGVLEVVGGENNSIVFATLNQGAVVGEISLLAIGGNNRRTASIRSKGYSTLFVLAKEDLNDVIRYYPQAQALMKRKAAEMLNKDKKGDDKGKEKQQQEMEDRCKINPLGTPKMLKIVADLLPKENKTTMDLLKAIDFSASRRQSMHYPWSTLQVEDENEEWTEGELSDAFEEIDEDAVAQSENGDSEAEAMEDVFVVEDGEEQGNVEEQKDDGNESKKKND